MKDNVYRLFAERFLRDPSRTFIETDEGTCSYADLERETARLGRFFTELGLEKGDRIAVQVEKSPEALWIYLATVRAGFVYLPLNPAYTPAELEHYIRDAGAKIFIGTPEREIALREMLQGWGVAHVFGLGTRGEGSLVVGSRQVPPDFETAKKSPDDVAALLYTSGTTGRPKGAMLTHRNLGSNALALHETWGWRTEDVLLHALPIFHVHGLFVATHCALLGGSKMIFLPKFEPARVIRRLLDATVFMGVPTYYVRLLALPEFGAEACRNMRLFTSGSAPLLPETFRAFQERTGHVLLERYGMTETGMIASNPLHAERRAGSVGFPLPGVSIRVVGENEKPAASDEIGQVEVRGENVFTGYFGAPEKTRQAFTPDGFFKTGDLGCLDLRGALTLVGRSNDLVITGGLNVYPKEIEQHIDGLEGVSESAVFGLPHPDFGEGLVAAVVLRTGAVLTEQEILAQLKPVLANFKIPKRLFFVPELPRNAMGKVQKNQLRVRYETVVRWS